MDALWFAGAVVVSVLVVAALNVAGRACEHRARQRAYAVHRAAVLDARRSGLARPGRGMAAHGVRPRGVARRVRNPWVDLGAHERRGGLMESLWFVGAVVVSVLLAWVLDVVGRARERRGSRPARVRGLQGRDVPSGHRGLDAPKFSDAVPSARAMPDPRAFNPGRPDRWD